MNINFRCRPAVLPV